MRMRAVAAVLIVLGIGALLVGCGKGSPPTVSTQPKGQTACAGGSITFSVVATGTAPLSYQWQKDGTAISGATISSYTISSVSSTHAGSYTVTVTNAAGSVTSSPATLSVNTAPSVSAHPASQAVCLGSPATLRVTATGTAPLTYQWKKDGSDIAGAVSDSHTINPVTAGDAGSYTVVITNACGSVTANVATLTVNTAPSITTHPASQTVRVGDPVTFSVAATGTAPLSYQWQKNGSDIAGAASASYTIATGAAGDAGSYTVVITNACGRATSDPATLTVTTPPATPEPVPPAIATGPIATVNGRPLDREAFDDIKASIRNYYAQMYAQFGLDIRLFLTGARGRVFELELELAALDGLLTQGLVEAEAERRGIVVAPEAIEAEFQKQYQAMLDNYKITEQYLADYFQAQGTTLDAFKDEGRAQVAEQLVYQAVRETIAGPIDLTADELRAYFEDHRADYGTEEEVEASHILVKTEDEAKTILAELAAGADFAELARARSTDTGSAAQGGKLGWFGRGAMVPEFEEAAFALKVGERSGIVQSQFGFHIILLTNRREATQPKFEEVADRVRADAAAEIVRERFEAWLAGAKKAASVVIYDPLLDAMHKKSQDVDLGIAAFEKIRDAGKVEEPYLSFLIGSAYEEKMTMAQAEQARLEEAPDTPDRSARIAALDATIEEARVAALAAYRQALTDLGEDEDVADRIAALEATGPVPR